MTNKKEAIIDAAIMRIADHGCTFSTGQIASDLGCSQSLIFRYYRSKEGLVSACFDRVCHELKQVMRSVEVPSKLTRESIEEYLMDLWKSYCKYLGSNGHIARVYMYFASIGRRFPHRYRSADMVLRNILEEDYDRIVKVHPDFKYAAEYMVMLSNATATGKFIDWGNNPDTSGKLDAIIMHGILGLGKEDGSP